MYLGGGKLEQCRLVGTTGRGGGTGIFIISIFVTGKSLVFYRYFIVFIVFSSVANSIV